MICEVRKMLKLKKWGDLLKYELNTNEVKDQSIESELNLAINESKNQSLLKLLKECLRMAVCLEK